MAPAMMHCVWLLNILLKCLFWTLFQSILQIELTWQKGGGLEEWPKFNIETIKPIKKKKVLGEIRWNYIFLTSSHREKVMKLEGNKTISN